ncbi:MAG: hypothetical protein WCI74_19365 [Actinomycetes bacterium]
MSRADAEISPTSRHETRSRRFRGVWLGGIVSVALLAWLPATTATAAPTADQSHSGAATAAYGVDSSQYMGQTFTPSVSDGLSQVSVKIFYWNNSGPVTMKIYDTAGGLPTGAPLASQLVTGIPTAATWVDCDGLSPVTVTFSSPATLVSGTLYAFTLESTTSGFNSSACVNTSAYAGGNSVGSNPLPAWFAFAPRQLLFTTYMGAAAPPSDTSPTTLTVIHQGLPMPASGNCADVQDAAVAYGTGLHGGWIKGWEPWPVSGNPAVHGGWACIRAIVNPGGQAWSINNAYA